MLRVVYGYGRRAVAEGRHNHCDVVHAAGELGSREAREERHAGPLFRSCPGTPRHPAPQLTPVAAQSAQSVDAPGRWADIAFARSILIAKRFSPSRIEDAWLASHEYRDVAGAEARMRQEVEQGPCCRKSAV